MVPSHPFRCTWNTSFKLLKKAHSVAIDTGEGSETSFKSCHDINSLQPMAANSSTNQWCQYCKLAFSFKATYIHYCRLLMGIPYQPPSIDIFLQYINNNTFLKTNLIWFICCVSCRRNIPLLCKYMYRLLKFISIQCQEQCFILIVLLFKLWHSRN